MSQRTLVAYYSMTGNTRRIAEEIGAAIGADVEEIREPHPRHGATGVVRALVDSIARREPPIEPAVHDPAHYDLLIVGGPIWAGRMAAPVRTYAHRYGGSAPRVAFFCTEGGRGADKAFHELETFCHHEPRATMVVDAEHLESDAHRNDLRRFANSMQLSVH